MRLTFCTPIMRFLPTEEFKNANKSILRKKIMNMTFINTLPAPLGFTIYIGKCKNIKHQQTQILFDKFCTAELICAKRKKLRKRNQQQNYIHLRIISIIAPRSSARQFIVRSITINQNTIDWWKCCICYKI